MKKAKETAIDPMSIGRHTGEHIWGYEVLSDGSIKLSPGFADRFRVIVDRETGLLAMQEAVVRHVAQELGRTAKERRRWWEDLHIDTGISAQEQWNFEMRDGVVSKVKNEQPSPAGEG